MDVEKTCGIGSKSIPKLNPQQPSSAPLWLCRTILRDFSALLHAPPIIVCRSIISYSIIIQHSQHTVFSQ